MMLLVDQGKIVDKKELVLIPAFIYFSAKVLMIFLGLVWQIVATILFRDVSQSVILKTTIFLLLGLGLYVSCLTSLSTIFKTFKEQLGS